MVPLPGAHWDKEAVWCLELRSEYNSVYSLAAYCLLCSEFFLKLEGSVWCSSAPH